MRHPLVYAFYTGIIEIFAVVLLPFGFTWPNFSTVVIALLSGVFFIVALIFFFNAVIRFEISKVAPIVGSMVPVVLFGLSFFRADFSLSSFQIIALFLLIVGGILVSYKKIPLKNFPKLFGFSIAAAVFFGLSYFLIKIAYGETTFITGFTLARIGGFLAALSMLAIPLVRREVTETTFSIPTQSVAWVGVNKAIAALAFMAIHYATFLGDATLVQALGGIQYVFLKNAN